MNIDQPLKKQTDDEHKTVDVKDIGVSIRAFRYDNNDYEAMVAIDNAIQPERPTAVEVWQHFDRTRDPKYFWQRYVVERHDEIVAIGDIGEPFWSYEPGKYLVYIVVYPEFQSQGIGTVFYEHLMRLLAPRRPRKLLSFTRENCETGVRFLEARGFRQVMRVPVSRLDSATFNSTRFQDKLQQVLNAGIVIKTMSELRNEDPDWKRKLYELTCECAQDVPLSGPRTTPSFEEFERTKLQQPTLLPDALFIALDGNRYVGLSVLKRNLATDRLLETGLTGVVRSHRRRGIATALKVKAIQYAQQHGNAIIETNNEENNPMLQLNLQLGFVPQPAQVDFVKQLDE